MIQTTSIKLNNFSDFANACKHFGIEINNNQLILFKKYYEILLEWNKKINLISRKDVSLPTILEKHFLDSIIFLPEILSLINNSGFIPHTPYLNTQCSVFDIGSGGGFPGVPLAIINPHWRFTLCESTKKKSIFLSHLISQLELTSQIKILNERVENINQKKEYCSIFDLVTVRAVEKLNTLIEYSLPLLKQGGNLLAYKAEDITNEMQNVDKLVKNKKLTVKIFEKEINKVRRKLICVKKQS
ncbi:MAG: 16S rRNA (guanine(527)-N(7))-methyltransferase RsmG [Candidatus Melainabacteria bacterium]|nr:16S rRNA (guanine(527)-N(7))-methyltransferase RsmG [Candidatus Melainabacteria bacterium]MBI3308175.1 16S rRNA (guanine(527)-N(7))-methyltransferase RsmG [Candidatus Melainabacteria bacterium]